MNIRRLLAVILLLVIFSATALAVVTKREWTPDDATRLSVIAKMGDEGLVHFRVTRKLLKPCWIQSNLVIRKGKTRIAETHFPAFVRENSITYSFEILPEYLDDSTFELDERAVGYSVNASDDLHPLPVTGGNDTLIRLKLFVK